VRKEVQVGILSEISLRPREVRRLAGIDRATRRLLLGGVIPVWLGAGFADWYLHRRTHIERTAGARESALHSLMLAQASVPTLLGLFCDVNATVLATSYVAAGVHSATTVWDQVYAEDRRRVSRAEQHVHSLLEVTPLMAVVLLTALHWDQAIALTGRDTPRFGLRLKRQGKLSASARLWLLAAVAVFGALPYAEEFVRCWRTKPTLEPLPTPPEPATETLRISEDGETVLDRAAARRFNETPPG
jgi:hypothetical protein